MPVPNSHLPLKRITRSYAFSNKASSPCIVAIDTSCDDTSVAVTQGTTVLANVIASQTQLHKQYGGVFPTLAKQAHRDNLPATLHAALKRARIAWSAVEAIAVTQGPGLAPALEVGLHFARELAEAQHKPLLPVNHLEGHLLSVLAQPKRTKAPQSAQVILHFPVLGIIVSGGHTEFVLIEEVGTYTLIGQTLDDAAGEVLDKVGRMLDLGYPAGPVMEKFARKGNPLSWHWPLPMTTSGDFNMSFSGLKTHARTLIERLSAQKALSSQDVCDIAASFQKAVFRAIGYKLEKVLTAYPELTEIWLGGGVAANTALRQELRQVMNKVFQKRAERGASAALALRLPYTKKLCSDNAAMIGVAAGFQLHTSNALQHSLRQPISLDRRPRWEIGSP